MSSLNQIIETRLTSLAEDIQCLADSKIHQITALDLCNEFVSSYINHVHSQYSDVPIDFDNLEDTEFHIVEMAGLLIDDRFIQKDARITKSRRDFHYFKIKAYMRNQLFIAIMGELEDFLSKMLLLVLKSSPEKLGEQKLKLQQVECKFSNFCWVKEIEKSLNFPSSENLVEQIDRQIEKAVMEMIYKGPDEYIKKIQLYLEIEEKLLWWIWPLYTEMKARRNAGLHNGWERNEKYDEVINPIRKKLKDIEQREKIPCPISESDFLGIDSDYFAQTYKLARQVIDKLTSHCLKTFKTANNNNVS